MENEEVSIITHLLEIEKTASAVITAATVDSEKKVTQAKIASDEEVKKIFTAEAEKLQSQFDSKLSDLQRNHKKDMEDYKQAVSEMSKNKSSFEENLGKILFEE